MPGRSIVLDIPITLGRSIVLVISLALGRPIVLVITLALGRSIVLVITLALGRSIELVITLELGRSTVLGLMCCLFLPNNCLVPISRCLGHPRSHIAEKNKPISWQTDALTTEPSGA